jgi:hypothetical protein
MGFWIDTPNITYWDAIKSIWCQTTPPFILKKNVLRPIYSIPYIIFKPADFKNAVSYSHFIKTNFVSNINIPSEIISKGFAENKWLGIEARDIDLNLIGLIISKPISHFYSSEFPRNPLTGVGLVDYFCILPAWRKKGLGTRMLFKLHELTQSVGRIPHIFSSEGYFLFTKIPQIIQDKYIWRERYPKICRLTLEVQKNISFTEDFLTQIQKGIGGKNFFAVNFGSPTEISHYFLEGYHILVKPTYEQKDRLQSQPVGEIITFWSDPSDKEKEYLFDVLLDCIKEFDIFIAPSEFPRSRLWKEGAPFGFFPFHFHPGAFDTKRLLLLI